MSELFNEDPINKRLFIGYLDNDKLMQHNEKSIQGRQTQLEFMHKHICKSGAKSRISLIGASINSHTPTHCKQRKKNMLQTHKIFSANAPFYRLKILLILSKFVWRWRWVKCNAITGLGIYSSSVS